MATLALRTPRIRLFSWQGRKVKVQQPPDTGDSNVTPLVSTSMKFAQVYCTKILPPFVS
jgi:hypothetical protein